MLKKILVCLDGTEFAEGILPHVLERALHFDSKVVLLKVVNSNVSSYISATPGITGQTITIIPLAQVENIIRREEMKDKSYLNGVAANLIQLGLEVDCIALRRAAGESIGDAIINCAVRYEADLIMMATHRRSFWKHLLFGSITESVIRNSAQPVLVVNPQTDRKEEGSFGEIPQASLT